MLLHPDGLLPHVAEALQERGQGDPVAAFEKVAREQVDLAMYCSLGDETPARSLAAAVKHGGARLEQRERFRDWIMVKA